MVRKKVLIDLFLFYVELINANIGQVAERISQQSNVAPSRSGRPIHTDDYSLSIETKCKNWKTKYNVIPGFSWGDLPLAQQASWKIHGCDIFMTFLQNSSATL